MVVGLVGCGQWGQYILRDLRELGCAVHVVARSEASIARAKTGGAAKVVPDVEGLDGVSGIVVATPSTTHVEVVERSLALGVPVACEKPLCVEPRDALRLAELAPDRLFVLDKWRYHPGITSLGEIARSQALGGVCGLKTVRVGWGSQHDDVDVVWHLAPHDLAIALEILGELLPPAAAVAQTASSQVVSLVAVMSGEATWHVLEVSERSPERVRRVELHCEEGVAVLADGWDNHLSVFRHNEGAPDEELIPTPGELPLLAELRAFASHLEGGSPPRSSAAEGALVVHHITRLRELAGTT